MARSPSAARAGRSIQALVGLSVVLGVLFLVQAYGVLPSLVFDFVAAGWALFVVDLILTFVSPRPAYALALVLAVLALVSSLPQSSHWAFVSSGDLVPAATFLGGSAAQLVLVFLVPYYFVAARRGSE